MEGTFDRETTPATLRLEGELEIGDAGELQARLLEALALGQPIRLQLEGITGGGCDWIAAADGRGTRGPVLAWRGRSAAFCESLRRREDGDRTSPFAGDAA